MAISAGDLVKRALRLDLDGFDPHEVGHRLVEIAKDKGHPRAQLTVNESDPIFVEISLPDTGELVYFNGNQWGHLKQP